MGDENCWYVHEPKDEPETSEEFKCNECERQFTFTYDFFKHRKKIVHNQFLFVTNAVTETD